MGNLKYYTGVGSRRAPQHALLFMERLAASMGERGFIGRSGLAEGSDQAFTKGAWESNHRFDSFLPNSFFEVDAQYRFQSDKHCMFVANKFGNYEQAEYIVSQIHPKWKKLSHKVKALHTRNVYQVLGYDLNTPSEVFFCWAPPKSSGVDGGTNTGYQLAKSLGIEMYNFYFGEDMLKVREKYLCKK